MEDLENRTEEAIQAENEAIAGTLDQILSQRQELAAEMDQTAGQLKKEAVRVEKLEQAANSLRGFSDHDRQMLFGSKEGCETFVSCVSLAREYKTRLLAAAEAYEALGVRFRRQSVNLGVIGKQGAGKSCLLQALSGLTNDYIPSNDGPSCTGVTCIIENVPELTAPEVYFTLKDEKTVEREVNQELENLWTMITGDPSGAPRLDAREDWKASLQAAFQDMETQMAQRGIIQGAPYVRTKNIYSDQFDTWRPLVFPTKPLRSGPDHAKLPDELWASLSGQWREAMRQWSRGLKPPLELDPNWEEMDAPRCRLTDLGAVAKYVSKCSADASQDDGRNIYQYYSYHLAICEAHIRIAFPGIKSHICLIDTVGIGDGANDTPDRMNRAIDVNSDGLIFLHRYPAPGRDILSLDETPEIKDLGKICEDRAATRPGDWVAFLMNVVPKPDCSSEWIANYFDPRITPAALELPPHAVNPQKIRGSAAGLANYTNSLTENVEGIGLFSRNSSNQNGRYIRLRYIADVNQPNSVKHFLNRFLKQISEHLTAIDDAKKSGAKDKWKAAEEAKDNLTSALQSLCLPPSNDLNTIRCQMNGKQELLRANLAQFYARTQENLNSPLQTCYDNILQLCDDQKLREIVSDINQNFGQPRTLLRASEKLYQIIRRTAMTSSSAYEQRERLFKEDLAEILVDTLGIDLSKLNNGKSLKKSDDRYFEKLGKLLFRNTPGANELENFFQSIQRFHLNDSSVMAEAIVCHAAAKNLCINNMRELVNVGSMKDKNTGVPAPGPNAAAAAGGGVVSVEVNAGGRRGAAASANIAQTQRSAVSQPHTEGLIDPRGTEEIVNILHHQLTGLLADIQASLSIEATYIIPPQERLKEEIMNFSICFGEPYKDIWLCVFNDLYDSGAILQNEAESLHRICTARDHIRQRVSEYLTSPQ